MKLYKILFAIQMFLSITIITNAQYSGGIGRGDTSVLKVSSYLGNTWLTNLTSNFSDPNNWSNGNFPNIETAFIPSGGTQPIIAASSGNAIIPQNTNINILSGGLLTINAGSKLTLNAEASIFVDGSVANNGSLILKSDAIGTASVGISTGSISGNVTVERYIPAKRAWRFLSTPLKGNINNSIFYNWQNNDQIVPNYGVEIWSPTNGVADPSSTNAGMMLGGSSTSIKQYLNNSWSSLTNTNGLSSQPTLFDATTNNALCVFVTAPYNNGNTNINAAAVATTLSATGNLIMGTHTKSLVPTSSGQYLLVANPYASSVNPSSITLSGNIASNFYMWDPNCVGSYNVGQYTTYSRTAQTYNLIGVGSGSLYNNSTAIQSGQAFFVQVNDNQPATVTFNESDKAIGSKNIFRTNSGIVQVMRHTLRRNIGGTLLNLDGALGIFYDGGNAAVDYNDAIKFSNSTENIVLRRANGSYAIEERPLITDKDTLFIRIWNTQQSAYTLELTGENFTNTPGLTATLKDAYTNTNLPLSITDTNRYNFTVDANAASTGDRFMIVFKANEADGTLPVQFTNINATQKGAAVQINWKVATEQNIKQYVEEKSTNASNFITIATQAANNIDNSSYNAMDNSSINGSNYYRILSTDNSGKQQYSNVAVVKIGKKENNISVYPNPIIENKLNIHLQNVSKGNYTIELINTSGISVFKSYLQHEGASGSQSIHIPTNISSGNYVLKAVDEQGVVFTEKVVVGNKF